MIMNQESLANITVDELTRQVEQTLTSVRPREPSSFSEVRQSLQSQEPLMTQQSKYLNDVSSQFNRQESNHLMFSQQSHIERDL